MSFLPYVSRSRFYNNFSPSKPTATVTPMKMQDASIYEPSEPSIFDHQTPFKSSNSLKNSLKKSLRKLTQKENMHPPQKVQSILKKSRIREDSPQNRFSYINHQSISDYQTINDSVSRPTTIRNLPLEAQFEISEIQPYPQNFKGKNSQFESTRALGQTTQTIGKRRKNKIKQSMDSVEEYPHQKSREIQGMTMMSQNEAQKLLGKMKMNRTNRSFKKSNLREIEELAGGSQFGFGVPETDREGGGNRPSYVIGESDDGDDEDDVYKTFYGNKGPQERERPKDSFFQKLSLMGTKNQNNKNNPKFSIY